MVCALLQILGRAGKRLSLGEIRTYVAGSGDAGMREYFGWKPRREGATWRRRHKCSWEHNLTFDHYRTIVGIYHYWMILGIAMCLESRSRMNGTLSPRLSAWCLNTEVTTYHGI